MGTLTQFSGQEQTPDSHARWMLKAIYTLKLTLLKHQLPELPWNKKQKLDKMTFFILFVYLESWFRSSSLFTAACDDLKLHQRLLKFQHIHNKLANVGLSVLQHHTWYLTQELVPVCLFNNNISEDMKNKIVEKISNFPVDNLSIQKPVLPKIGSKSLVDYIGPRSTTLFSILGISHKFLGDPNWRKYPKYIKIEMALKNLTPIDDSCERALALATKFNGHIARDEEQYQNLVLVVEAHRKKFSIMKKSDLRRL